MRTAYRTLAYVIALDVAAQAAMIALGMFGVMSFVEGGGALEQGVIESGSIQFTGEVGFAIHSINGTLVFPLLALALLVVAVFARIPQGRRWALGVVAVVALQVALGYVSHMTTPWLGVAHGANALVLFTLALAAGRRVRTADRSSTESVTATTTTPTPENLTTMS